MKIFIQNLKHLQNIKTIEQNLLQTLYFLYLGNGFNFFPLPKTVTHGLIFTTTHWPSVWRGINLSKVRFRLKLNLILLISK